MPKPNEQLPFDFYDETLRDDLLSQALPIWIMWKQGHLRGTSFEADQEMNVRFGELSVPILEYKKIGVIP